MDDSTALANQAKFLESEMWLPSHFDLHLTFNLTCEEFIGNCLVHVECLQPMKVMTLNAINTELKFVDAQLQQQKKWKGSIKIVDDPSVPKLLKLVFSEPLPKGKSIIGLKYKGSVREDGLGIYKCPKSNSNNKELPLIVSHFEPYFASLCFPCLIDPSVRTTIALTVTIPQDLEAISCMSIKEQMESEKEGFSTWSFESTPAIPSYLLGFAVGKFLSEEQEYTSTGGQVIPMKSYVPFGYYTDSQMKSIAKLLLDTALPALQTLENYFDIPFWLPKLDFVAVPHMLLAGMEHLGCCFLHALPTADDWSSMQQDVLHEIAHQWIGNLVGMSIRMKEGLVQYIEKMLAEKIFGSFQKKQPRKKNAQVKGIASNKKGSQESIRTVLLSDFNTALNEDFYQKSLKVVETSVQACGEKEFQKRLSSILKEFSDAFVEDAVVEEKVLVASNLDNNNNAVVDVPPKGKKK